MQEMCFKNQPTRLMYAMSTINRRKMSLTLTFLLNRFNTMALTKAWAIVANYSFKMLKYRQCNLALKRIKVDRYLFL